MAQIHHILNDQAIFDQFERVLLDDHVPWADRLTDVYQLIKTHKPEVWDQISLVLDRIEADLGKMMNYNNNMHFFILNVIWI